MTSTDEPSADDLIGAEYEAEVFLGPMAARRVQAQTLDANVTDIRAGRRDGRS